MAQVKAKGRAVKAVTKSSSNSPVTDVRIPHSTSIIKLTLPFSLSTGSLSSFLVLHLLEPGLDLAKLVVEHHMGNDTYASFNGPEEIQGLLGPMGQADGYGFRKRLF